MTTEYLLDTNACIAIRNLLNGKTAKNPEVRQQIEQLKARWSRVPADSLAMSVITLGELRFGAEKSAQAAKALGRLAALQKLVAVLPLDEQVTAHYGRIRATLETKGEKIGPNDTWIAAHGCATGRTVVTHNVGEFSRVPGLKHEDWTV